MKTTILVFTLFGLFVDFQQNVRVVVKDVKAVHHHFTRPIYRHVLKPVGKKLSH